MKIKRQKLRRVLGRVEVFALAFGTMIGWAWIMLSSQWIDAAGVFGAMTAFLIGGFMCIFVGLTYAELTSAFPLAGGELAFSYRGMGYLGSWITGWTISFAYVCVAAWEGIALSTAFDYLLGIPHRGYLWSIAGYDVYLSWSIVGVIAAVILATFNILGVKPVAVFQILMIMIMLFTAIVFVLGGIAFGNPDNMVPAFTSVKGIGMVLIIAPSMYIGFDMVSKSAEEMNMPLSDIAKVLIVSIISAIAWYILIILGTALSAPSEFRGTALVPVADSAAYAFESGIFGKAMIVGGIFGILTSWNGFIIGASRIFFAMGRAKMLPGIFAVVHPKYQTPVVSIIFVGLLCCLSPFLGEKALIWLVDSASVGTVVAYMMVAISFLSLRKREPNLRRNFKVKNGRLIGMCALGSALFFLYWYTPLSPTGLKWHYEWVLVLGWISLGILLLIFRELSGSESRISEKELEILMFGEEYAREL